MEETCSKDEVFLDDYEFTDAEGLSENASIRLRQFSKDWNEDSCSGHIVNINNDFDEAKTSNSGGSTGATPVKSIVIDGQMDHRDEDSKRLIEYLRNENKRLRQENLLFRRHFLKLRELSLPQLEHMPQSLEDLLCSKEETSSGSRILDEKEVAQHPQVFSKTCRLSQLHDKDEFASKVVRQSWSSSGFSLINVKPSPSKTVSSGNISWKCSKNNGKVPESIEKPVELPVEEEEAQLRGPIMSLTYLQRAKILSMSDVNIYERSSKPQISNEGTLRDTQRIALSDVQSGDCGSAGENSEVSLGDHRQTPSPKIPPLKSKSTPLPIAQDKRKSSVSESKVHDSHFEICKPVVLLGMGRYGEVFKVRNKGNGRFYAQKVIKKKQLSSKIAKIQFRSEINVLMRCKHPNLIRMYEKAVTNEAYYITVELCLGSARDFFKDVIPLSEVHTRLLMGQIIQAVDYLHTQGIIHRDLKLGNVLVASPFHIKLADFGMSKVFDTDFSDDIRTNTVVGTQFMKSPEQLRRAPYSFKIDCWAIGLITWQFLIGGMPFLLRTKKQINRACRGLRIPHRVSRDGSDFIKKLLDPNEEERPTPYNALLHPFIFESPTLNQVEQTWDQPYNMQIVQALEKDQLTPKQYIAQLTLDDGTMDDSSGSDSVILYNY